eukprot:2695563-Amphidinium_carterae.1
MTGDRNRIQTLLAKSDWGVRFSWSLVEMVRRLMPQLQNINRKVAEVLDAERLKSYPSMGTHGSWVSFMFSAWRQSGIDGPFSIGHELVPLTSAAEEASASNSYWSAIFQKEEPLVVSSLVSDFVVPLPWNEVEFTSPAIMRVILHSNNSTPGPDGVAYGHLRKLPHIASQVAASIAEDVMYNDARLAFGFDEAYQ